MSDMPSAWSDVIQFEDRIPGDQSVWGHEGILFKVDGGLGRLVVKYGTDQKGELYRFMMLGEQPMMYSYGDNGYCPTCAHMLGVGLGQQQADANLIETVEHAQQTDQSTMASFEQITPMLAMLEDGYYILTRIEMIPTDGEGNFFWNVSDSKRMYPATANQIFYREHVGNSTPKFLVPSQPMQHLDRERVDHYGNEIKQGKRMTGLAYYYEGFISTLLDGHHRATAAYMENQTVDCLTLLPLHGYTAAYSDQPIRLYAGGERYESPLFHYPQQIISYLERTPRPGSSKLSTNKVETMLQLSAVLESKEEIQSKERIQAWLDREKRTYHNYIAIAFADYSTDSSDERIAELMKQTDDDAQFELDLIFKRLAIDEPERIVALAKRILAHPAYGSMEEDIFRYLALIDDEEIEDLFIEYVLDHGPDSKDRCRQIANEYLNHR